MTDIETKFWSYIEGVENNTILTNKWIKLMVKRFREDLKRQGTEDFPYVFDFSKAERIIQFGQLLKQVNDDWAGEPLVFMPWQVALYGQLYGWTHKYTGLRRFRKAFIYITRKSGKSTMVAVSALWDLLSTNGSQVCLGATTRAQSKIIYDIIVGMVEQNPILSKRLRIYKSTSTIVNYSTYGKIEALSSESKKTGDGKNCSLALLDEAAASDYGIAKILESGMGSRPEPLMLMITSGSTQLDSMGYTEYDRSTKILQNILQDETYFCCLYCLDEEDDWLDESKYGKACPSLGITVKPEFLHNLKIQAEQNYLLQSEFKTKNLGLWCNPESTWINYRYWEVCAQNAKKYKFDKDKTYYANIAIDLSKVNDLTALTLCIYQDGKYFFKHKLYFPMDSFKDRITKETQLWQNWFDTGVVTSTPGKTIDYDYLIEEVGKLASEYEINECLYDPYCSTKIVSDLENSLVMVPIPQNLKNLSPYAKSYEKAILDGDIVDDNPFMKWAISNAKIYTDANNNIKIIKNNNKGTDVGNLHIDPVITSSMCQGRISSLLDAGEVDIRSPEQVKEDTANFLKNLNF